MVDKKREVEREAREKGSSLLSPGVWLMTGESMKAVCDECGGENEDEACISWVCGYPYDGDGLWILTDDGIVESYCAEDFNDAGEVI